MGAALHGHKTETKPKETTWPQVYRLAAKHSIQSLVLTALPDGAFAEMPERLSSRWRHDADMTLFQQVSYDFDREAILADLSRAGLSWMPLKGIIVATYYPQPGMRSMSDQDIVVGYVEPDGHGGYRPRGGAERSREETARADAAVTAIMRAHGYASLSDGRGRDHSYAKAPLHFEMHHSMLSVAEVAEGMAANEEMDYYANPWGIARPVSSVPGEFRFNIRDEYVFHVDHMSKHYRGSGFGLRFLADEYLYCMKFPDAVADPRVTATLRRLGIDHFERAVRELSMTLFSHPGERNLRLPRELRELLVDVFSGGTYGSRERGIAHRLASRSAVDVMGEHGARRVGRARYLWNRLFPPLAWVETYYPEWSHSRAARFLLAFHRLSEGMRNDPRQVWRTLRYVLWRR